MPRALPHQRPDEPEDAVILDGDFQDVTDLAGDIDDALNTITSEFDADTNDVEFKIKAYKVQEKTGKSAYLFNCLPEELPIMDRLRDEYGSGIYQVRVYRNKKLFRRFNYTIQASSIQKNPPQQNSGPDLSSVLNAMAQQQQIQFAQMKELMMQVTTRSASTPVPVAPPINMMEIMTGMAGLLASLKGLTGGSSDTGSAMQMFIKGIEIAKDMGSDSGGSNFIDLARDAMKVLPSALEMARLSGPVAKSNPVTRPVPTKNSTPVITSPTKPTEENMNVPKNNATDLGMLSRYLPQLIEKAKQGSDPGLYAEFILDNVPTAMIAPYISDSQLIEKLTAINPQVTNYSDWFKNLQHTMQELLTPEPLGSNLSDHAASEFDPESIDGTSEGDSGS